MNKTGIEWVRNPDGSQGYTWNPITGCLNHDNGLCKGGGFPCYAYKLANGRLKQRYLGNANVADISNRLRDPNSSLWDKVATDPFYPRFWEERLFEPVNKTWEWGRQRRMVSSQYPKGIFVCDMGDLFGIGIPEEWTRRVTDRFQYAPQHRFYLLTKQPQNLIKFSPFPDNCWVGVTATSVPMFVNAMDCLYDVKAKVKFLSFEPLLEWHIEPDVLYGDFKAQQLNWLIIGACTGTGIEMLRLAEAYKREDGSVMPYGNKFTLQPKIEWVQEIVKAADKAGIPVFLKDSLRPLLIPEDCSKPNYLTEDVFWASEKAQLRQEIPKRRIEMNYPEHKHPHGIDDVPPDKFRIWVCDECCHFFTDNEIREDTPKGWGHSCKSHPCRKGQRCESHLEPYMPSETIL